jgi:hypothetical protein
MAPRATKRDENRIPEPSRDQACQGTPASARQGAVFQGSGLLMRSAGSGHAVARIKDLPLMGDRIHRCLTLRTGCGTSMEWIVVKSALLAATSINFKRSGDLCRAPFEIGPAAPC